jgi:hypothetical protein
MKLSERWEDILLSSTSQLQVCRNALCRDQQQQNITQGNTFLREKNVINTIKRARFFDANDSKGDDVSIARVCRKLDFNLPPLIARLWLNQRNLLHLLRLGGRGSLQIG